MGRIDRAFAAASGRGTKALIPYLMAGDPSAQFTAEAILALEEAGADLVEIGVPFSDPVADGPVIQKASARALANGMSLVGALKIVERVRRRSRIPLILMTYANPLLARGISNFAREAAEAGADGFIIPDLPFDEAELFASEIQRRGLDLIHLVAPTTPEARARAIAAQTRGFLYYVSLIGITGSPIRDLSDTLARVRRIKRFTPVPVAVGFGVSTPQQAAQIGSAADGVVVGSALVKMVEEKPDLDLLAAFVRSLKRVLSPS